MTIQAPYYRYGQLVLNRRPARWDRIFNTRSYENRMVPIEVFSVDKGKRDAPLFVQGQKAPSGTGDIHAGRKPLKYCTRVRTEKREPPETDKSRLILCRGFYKHPNQYICQIPWKRV